jgi:sugar O-acyltransferase (sialic acid O-acetyltransferase NeuD family)
MKTLIIVGASGFGKEVAWLAESCGYKVCGYLDDNDGLEGKDFYRLPVLGKVDDAVKYPQHEFVVAIGNPIVRKKIVNQLFMLTDKIKFATLIHPDCVMSDTVYISEGCIIASKCLFTVNIAIGKHCVINVGATIGHDSNVGDFSTLAPKSNVCGNVSIGNVVEIGTASSIVQGVSIGDSSMICMGSIVLKDVETYTVVMGNPARVIKKLSGDK